MSICLVAIYASEQAQGKGEELIILRKEGHYLFMILPLRCNSKNFQSQFKEAT